MKSSLLAVEEMISLSNLIKSSYYIAVDDLKLIEVAQKLVQQSANAGANEEKDELPAEIQDSLAMKEQILQDAQHLAEEKVRQAMEETATMKEQAKLDIEKWWQEQRTLDEQYASEAKQTGFDQGFLEGRTQAESTVRQECEDMISEARRVLEQAYELKRQIVKEAEPFLIEIGCAVAAKIVDHELTVSAERVKDLAVKTLARKRHKGVITLCVAPQQFAYLQDVRDELLLSIDSQAELQIVPDSSIRDQGCIVRTSFGSVDATIETQLAEIKKALIEVAVSLEDQDDGDDQASGNTEVL